MAKTVKKARFQMDSATFAHIWNAHTSNDEKNDWHRFVINCFDRFSGSKEAYNINTLNSDPATEGWSNWEDDDKYLYLSDRCYAKCMSLRAMVKKETGKVIDLPNGYKSRNGKKSSKRVTVGTLVDIFGI